MSAPSNIVSQNGISQVSNDQLNTYVQWCTNVAVLRNFIGISNMVAYLEGYTTPGDGGQGLFYWNASGTSPDDNGVTTVVPTGSGSGEWNRLNAILPTIASDTILGNNTASPSSPIALTVSQAQSLLGISPISPISPQGRVTLFNGVSTLPVLTQDILAATEIFYAPYIGTYIPIWNGSYFVAYNISSALAMGLDSNSGHTGYQAAGSLFDIFIINYSTFGATLCTGPAWTNSTTRSAAIVQKNGIWVNNSSMIYKIDTSSFTGTVSANQATYVGTMYASANGQTQFNIKPSPALGGTGNIIGIWNAYNRVHVDSISRDSTTSWNNNSTSWNEANLSASNRISWVDGLQQVSVKGSYTVECSNGSNGDGARIGLNLNSTSATPGLISQTAFATASGATAMLVREESFPPQLGFNYIQAMDSTLTAGTATFFGNTFQSLIIQAEY